MTKVHFNLACKSYHLKKVLPDKTIEKERQPIFQILGAFMSSNDDTG